MTVPSPQERNLRAPPAAKTAITSARPRLSIVVVADVSRQWLEALVNALPRFSTTVEVLVMRPGGRRLSDERDSRHFVIRYVSAPAKASSADLRAYGIRHAIGDLVVFLDGDRPVDPGRLERLRNQLIGPSGSGKAATDAR